MSAKPYAVILAGGGGTRLWPLSSPERPKPFIPLVDGKTLLAATIDRLLPLILASDAQRALGRAFLGELTDFVANRPLAALREEFDAGELEVGPSDWTVGT